MRSVTVLLHSHQEYTIFAVHLANFVAFIGVFADWISLLIRYPLISYDRKPLICESMLPNRIMISVILSQEKLLHSDWMTDVGYGYYTLVGQRRA